jgi:hypothetical protein
MRRDFRKHIICIFQNPLLSAKMTMPARSRCIARNGDARSTAPRFAAGTGRGRPTPMRNSGLVDADRAVPLRHAGIVSTER